MAKQKAESVKAAEPATAPPKISSYSIAAAMEKYEPPKTTGKISGGIALWGSDNLMPSHNIRHYEESPTNSAIIRLTSDLVAGRELVIDGLQKGEQFFVGSSPKRFNLATARDYKIQGAFAWLVIWNREFTSIASVQHVDVSTIRKKMSEKGELQGFIVSNAWKGASRPSNAKDYPVFDPIEARKEWETIQADPTKTYKDSTQSAQIFWYEDYAPGSPTYPMPDWGSARRPIEIEIQFFKFHLNGIGRGYRPQLAFEVLGTYEPEDEKRIVKSIGDSCNPEGSNVFVHFSDYSGEKKPSVIITPIDGHMHDGKYIETAADAKQAIFTAHRLPSPTLAGVPGRGKLGGDGLEIEKAFLLYLNTTVSTAQVNILDAMEELFDLGGRPELTPKIKQVDPWLKFAEFATITAPEQTAEGGDKTTTTDTTTNDTGNGNA